MDPLIPRFKPAALTLLVLTAALGGLDVGRGAPPDESGAPRVAAGPPAAESSDSSDPAAGKFIPAFLKYLHAHGRERPRRQLELALGTAEDFWGACFITDNYSLCKKTFGRVKDAPPLRTPWQACKTGGARTQAECLQYCLNGQFQCDPSDVSMADWNQLCSAATVPQDLCLPSQAWGACAQDPAGPPGPAPCTPSQGTLEGPATSPAEPAAGPAGACPDNTRFVVNTCAQGDGLCATICSARGKPGATSHCFAGETANTRWCRMAGVPGTFQIPDVKSITDPWGVFITCRCQDPAKAPPR